MGRELVCQLIAEGAHVAMCDVSAENMDETTKLANAEAGQRLTSHICDVSSEAQVLKFRDEVAEQHQTEHNRHGFYNKRINHDGPGSGAIQDPVPVLRWFATGGTAGHHKSGVYVPY